MRMNACACSQSEVTVRACKQLGHVLAQRPVQDEKMRRIRAGQDNYVGEPGYEPQGKEAESDTDSVYRDNDVPATHGAVTRRYIEPVARHIKPAVAQS